MKFYSSSLLVAFFLLLFVSSCLVAQNPAPGQWLVQLPGDVAPANLLHRLDNQFGDPGTQEGKSSSPKVALFHIKLISRSLNTWLIRNVEGNHEILTWLRQQPDIIAAQQNHHISLRSNLLPNDPLVSQQWQYVNDGSNGGVPNADLDADAAWNISTGGLTMAGDTIVVAVIDGGISKNHPDLAPNLWKNRAEVPDDGIDNDGNGYTDDFEGWNVFSQNDDIQGITTIHGTPVSGVIGAVGNNGIGVTGVNWNVKIMFIAGGNLESDLLSAYDYLWQARKRYNDTNGAEGAFVVAANCSWGLDYGMPEDAPVWCAAFDKLGEAGILSVAATANNPVNVDLAGDLPTTCPSDFLISVTSLNRQDQKALSAAWGAVNIDLGAYGDGILTTGSGGQYGEYSGTSFAAPQVAGAIGLLYAAPCPELIAEAKNDPRSAALWAKSLLLNSVVANTAMQNNTLTGGRLNLFTLLQQYQQQCATCPAPFALKALNITPATALLKWSVVPGAPNVTLRWRKVGADWNIEEAVANEFLLEGLQPCSNYEFALQCTCSGGETSDWSPPSGFITSGCCVAPAFTWTTTFVEGGLSFSWNKLPDFVLYRILIHQAGTSVWQTYLSSDTSVVLQNLAPCTAYEIRIQGWCLDSWVNLTALLPIQSPGCGACLEKNYCVAGAAAAQEEWIEAVQVDTWLHDSGWGGGGYQNLTDEQPSNPQITPLSAVDVTLTPGFWGTPYKEYFRIFIDFNLDGDFDDVGELAFDPGFAQSGVVVGTLVTPAFTQSGTTRMRVMMKYAENGQIPPQACDTYDYGQVEDYCVDLVEMVTNAKIADDLILVLKIFPQPATNWACLDVTGCTSKSIHLKVWNLSGQLQLDQHAAPVNNNTILLDTTHWPSGLYFVTAQSAGDVFQGKLIKN